MFQSPLEVRLVFRTISNYLVVLSLLVACLGAVQSPPLPRLYQKWLNAEVVYIITPEERSAFTQLGTDAERDAYIESFWKRRNPTPDSLYNPYRTEFYRRITYANQQYTTGDTPGWKTDRGHVYILWGKPDKIVSDNPPANNKKRLSPYEDWVYNCLPGIGSNIVVKFSDDCRCGDFALSVSDALRQSLLAVPTAGAPGSACGTAPAR